ncbi:sugar kinase [Virgibacillus doumboii]|uniref:sugar kinase n=1 Tax=Virgibacillus doumboii TaxID=2697503 RepID=UPI0013DE812C|nr:sugar kinase [Virgibacillus doumboii]
MPEVVTLGETMAVFDGNKKGPLRYIQNYERHTGGAETNVAVGLIRLGHTAGWISRLGDDEFGHNILSVFKGEGVDVSQVEFDAEHPTGLFFRQKLSNGECENFYYRKGSAASFLNPENVDEGFISQAKILHITGITPLLSPTCRKAIEKSIKIAKDNNVKVSFDPNIRMKMLKDKQESTEIILDMMVNADIIFPGIDECKVLFNTENIDEIIKKTEKLGVETTVIKLGSDGAVGFSNNIKEEVSGFEVNVVDAFGAGDAFASGFLASQLKKFSLKDSLVFATAMGALTVTMEGNIESIPNFHKVKMFIEGNEIINR